jgi:holo-[acyl-carrier protein] synthase
MRGLSVGIDVVDVREVKRSLARFGRRYLVRVYTPDEIAYALEAPVDTARRLAARFAAKEATIKALFASEDGIDPRSIEVQRGPHGECRLILSGSALTAAHRSGVASLALSMSHQGTVAAAVVVAERSQKGRSRLWLRG